MLYITCIIIFRFLFIFSPPPFEITNHFSGLLFSSAYRNVMTDEFSHWQYALKRFLRRDTYLLSTHPSVYPPHRFFSQRQGEDLLLLNKTWYFEMGTHMQIQNNFNGKSSCFMKLHLCPYLLFSFSLPNLSLATLAVSGSCSCPLKPTMGLGPEGGLGQETSGPVLQSHWSTPKKKKLWFACQVPNSRICCSLG